MEAAAAPHRDQGGLVGGELAEGAPGLGARGAVTIREWLRTVATIPPRCFFFTTLLTSPGGTRPQPSQRLGLYASLGPNAPFFFVFSSPKNKKNTLDAH